MIRFDPANPRGIVWIASYPKSGNTWVRVYLYHLMRLAAGRPADGQELNRLGQSSAYELALTSWHEEIIGKPAKDFTFEDIYRARPRIQERIANSTNEIAALKTHAARVTINSIPSFNPAVTRGAVYLVRNPLDVVVSLDEFYEMGRQNAIAMLNKPDLVHKREENFEVWGSWSQNVASWTDQPNPEILVLRYEDMLADPVKAFAMVTRHMRLQAIPPQIVEAVEHSSFARMQEKEADTGFVEKPTTSKKFFREGRAGQWREQLNEDQIRQVVAAHHVQMKRHGYLTDELLQYVPAQTRQS
jgi:hypothetical protein